MTQNVRAKARFAAGSLLFVVTALAVGFAAGAHPALMEALADLMSIPDEADHSAPVDYGAGPGVKLQTEKNSDGALASTAPSQAIPTGGASASTGGVFGAVITWPIIPIHMVLLPDGRVMNYGTNESGAQGAQLIYDVWDPSLGTGTNSHMVLPNTTGTDIFCSSQSLMLSGEVLTSGGDLTINGKRNFSNNQTTIFSPSANTLTPNTPMNYARWYSTMVALPNGELAVFGGRVTVDSPTGTGESTGTSVSATTPERYDPSLGTWTSLTGVTSNAAFGGQNWYYPRAFVAPGGNVFLMSAPTGKMFFISTANTGSITQSTVTAPAGNIALPSVSFAPGKVLSLRMNQAVVVVDYTTSTPVVTPTAPMDQVRFDSSMTVLADGQVLVTGGSAVTNQLTDVDYQAEIWDPNTGNWTAGASASKPRLYHSNALLLPDATVLTGGGGAPGPVINLNAEIYYPPYLYAADGTPAARPTLSSTDYAVYNPGQTLNATVGPTDVIARMTLVRTGSATHSFNTDQRFIELSFAQTGQTVSAVLPPDNTVLIPGYYMAFVINSAGVPSVAQIVSVTTNAPVPNLALSAATVAFGTVQAGTASSARTVTLTNSGGTAYLTNTSFTGPGTRQFSQTNNCGTSLAEGASCTINVVFAPTAAGYTWANLQITGSGGINTAIVNGTGSVPFSASPATVSFGTVSVGTTTAAQPVTVTNLGKASLPISSITLTGSGASQFSQTSTCTTAVSVGSSCTINLAFTPASTGFIWAKLNVNAPGAAQTISVNGTGAAN